MNNLNLIQLKINKILTKKSIDEICQLLNNEYRMRNIMVNCVPIIERTNKLRIQIQYLDNLTWDKYVEFNLPTNYSNKKNNGNIDWLSIDDNICLFSNGSYIHLYFHFSNGSPSFCNEELDFLKIHLNINLN